MRRDPVVGAGRVRDRADRVLDGGVLHEEEDRGALPVAGSRGGKDRVRDGDESGPGGGVRRGTVRRDHPAEDRSANERAVRLSKKCGFLNKTDCGNIDMKCIDNSWLAWGFQMNFMYKTVC